MSEYQDYYKLLAVRRGAMLDEIKAAYRRRMRQLHPDKFQARRTQLRRSGNPGELAQLEKKIERAAYFTRQVNEAYAVLSDAGARARYDAQLAKMEHGEAMEYYGRTGGYDFYAQDADFTPPPPAKPESSSMTAAMFIGLILVTIVGFSGMRNVLAPNPSPRTVISATDQPRLTPTPTITPEPTRTAQQWARDLRAAGDAHLADGNYEAAIFSYTLGLEYVPTDGDLLLQRGLAAYESWQQSGDASYRETALSDLRAYAEGASSIDSEIEAILRELQDV